MSVSPVHKHPVLHHKFIILHLAELLRTVPPDVPHVLPVDFFNYHIKATSIIFVVPRFPRIFIITKWTIDHQWRSLWTNVKVLVNTSFLRMCITFDIKLKNSILSSWRASRVFLLTSSATDTESLLPTALSWKYWFRYYLSRYMHIYPNIDTYLALERTSNLSLKNWKVTRTGLQPRMSGPVLTRLTPRMEICRWRFSSAGQNIIMFKLGWVMVSTFYDVSDLLE